MEQAYSTKELSTILGNAPKVVLARAQRENWQSRPRVGRGGGKEWLVSSMPAATVAEIGLAQSKDVVAQGAKLPAKLNDRALEVDIPEKALAIGRARYRIVMEYRKLADQQKKLKAKDVQQAFITAYNSGTLLPEEFAVIGKTSMKTVYRWSAKLTKNGDDLTSLCETRGSWTSGGLKGTVLDPAVEKIVLNCYLQQSQPTMSLTYRASVAIAERSGLILPSYATIRRFLQKFSEINNDLVTFSRKGMKALVDMQSPYVTREMESLSVGDGLFCDGHVLNFEVIHPVTGRPHRPTLILWTDMRSRMPVGWEIMPSENTIAIASALRMALKNLGKAPKVAYLDNGRAFCGKFFTGDAHEHDGLYERLGITVLNARPYNARTKSIERFFRTMNEWFERLMPTYSGRNIDDKPAHKSRNEKYHQAWHEKMMGGKSMTMADCALSLASFFQYFANQPHDGLDGATPLALFNAGKGDGIDLGRMERHFMFKKKVGARRSQVNLFGIEYTADFLWKIKMDVWAYYSWSDMREVYIYDAQERFLGVVYPKQKVHPLAAELGSGEDLINLQEQLKAQKRAIKATKNAHKQMLEAFGDDDGLKVLDYVGRRAPAPLKRIAEEQEVEEEIRLTEEEVERAKASLERRIAEETAREEEKHKRPESFADALERYQWCFDRIYKAKLEVSAIDAEWMALYEASDEFIINFKKGFDDYRALYSLYEAQQANS